MKQSTFTKGTKYGFKEIKVGESKTIENVSKERVLHSLRNFNQVVEYKDMIMVTAEQVGDNVKVTRVF